MKDMTMCAQHGDLEGLAQALAAPDAHERVNDVDYRGRSPLLVAVQANQPEVVEALLAAGADCEQTDALHDTPLLAAAALGYGRCLSRLLAHGASATVLNRFSSTALMSASERGHADICRQLLEETDVDVNHQNTLGWTALIEAVLLGDGGVDYQRVVEQLLAHGADVNLADAEGVTPLAHARWRQFDALSERLEAAGGHEQGVAHDVSDDVQARTSTPRRA
ncbi:ankyrin repeat domain-containing protein [Cobetia amphilecti]|uniref:Ankyrin repeat domain-containing protein n=1 Tax=Cobetia amphilecti TaxID=1055104 RepID=A0AAP4U153_9GAMM|nr:ankyrin repeat domain-containing protein [Cobetia amphilecti]MDO6673468.1 ankyrin repeat domain-containing protein [Cobetia amphilecti]